VRVHLGVCMCACVHVCCCVCACVTAFCVWVYLSAYVCVCVGKSHVTHMNGSCHVYDQIVAHARQDHVT